MPLIILKWKNWLEKVRRIGAYFTKTVHRIFILLALNSDNPSSHSDRGI